jgi:membrane protein implicated in regulation of membrane protease activity
MTSQPSAPLTDSPWFWVLAFSLMALLAVAAISGKYGRRQAREERKYQASERIAAGETGAAASSETTGRRPYAMPGETLIPLWPLTLIMIVIALVAAVMLWRGQRGLGATDSEAPP